MQKKQTVSLLSTESIICLGKSKRLMEMRKSVEIGKGKDFSRNKLVFGADKQEIEIQQAREAVRRGITKIKASYRKGMQNRLFALRFGTEEEINQMTLQQLFNILNINESLSREIELVKYGGS